MERQKIKIELLNSVILDTSVIVKWFQREELLSKQAITLREAYFDEQIIINIPDLLVYELANVLRYKPDMDKTKIDFALQSLFDMEMDIYYVDTDLIKHSIQVSYTYSISVYDAIFVALSEFTQSDFITSDEKLLQKLYNIPYAHHLADLTGG
jgi:predicted nucleic acid-binding protein